MNRDCCDRSLLMDQRAIVCLFVLALRCALATADDQCARLSLLDGRQLVGRVIEDTLTGVTLEVWIGEFRSEVRYPRSQIADLKVVPCDELQADESENVPAADAGSPTAAAGAGPVVRYMLIPIKGTIGFFPDEPEDECVTGEGLHNALQRAKKAGVRHVVFYIDSPGGYSKDADDIVRVLREFQEDLTLIAVVRKSMSAAMWVTFGVSHIFVLPAASSGAALEYSQDPRTGSAAVDQKLLAATGAGLASWAESHGHNGAIARAMVDPSAELWATEGTRGTVLSEHRKNETSILIDGPDTVVALTAHEMLRYGVAKRIDSITNLGGHFEAPRWEQWGNYGEREMFNVSNALAKGERRAVAEYESLEQRLLRAVDGIGSMLRSAVGSARDAEPSAPYSYENVWTGSGRYQFTAAGRNQWRNDNQRAIQAWKEVANLVGHVAELLKEAERAVAHKPHSEYERVVASHRVRTNRLDEFAEQLRLIRPQLEHELRNANGRIDTLRGQLDRIGP